MFSWIFTAFNAMKYIGYIRNAYSFFKLANPINKIGIIVAIILILGIIGTLWYNVHSYFNKEDIKVTLEKSKQQTKMLKDNNDKLKQQLIINDTLAKEEVDIVLKYQDSEKTIDDIIEKIKNTELDSNTSIVRVPNVANDIKLITTHIEDTDKVKTVITDKKKVKVVVNKHLKDKHVVVQHGNVKKSNKYLVLDKTQYKENGKRNIDAIYKVFSVVNSI